MADIAQDLYNIRRAVYGEEVRESIAHGLETVNNESGGTYAVVGVIVAGHYIRADYTIGQNLTALDNALYEVPVKVGDKSETSGKLMYNTVNGLNSFSSGWQNTIDELTSGLNAGNPLRGGFTEGYGNKCHQHGNHLEGQENEGWGHYCHAEGYCNQVGGEWDTTDPDNPVAPSTSYSFSHVEGYENIIVWGNSHAAGYRNRIKSYASLTSGYNPDKSSANPKFVVGKYNAYEYDDFQYTAFVIGNGTADNTRSNALEVDYSGNMILAGTLTVAADPTSNLEVATKHYVDDICGSISSALAAILGGSAS